MSVLLVDPVGGVAGDMLLALFVDLGLEPDQLRADLAGLNLKGWRLTVHRDCRMSLSGMRVVVESNAEQPSRQWQDIDTLLLSSDLVPSVKERARRIFRRLAEVEAKVHDQPVESVHFHEVGAVDALIDIVGACIGLHRLGIETIYCGPLPLAGGRVQTEHGPLPLPAPATLELLRGVPVHWPGGEGEMVTPTGAAILTEVGWFETFPAAKVERIGYGLGARETADRPNVVRGMLCTSPVDTVGDQVVVLETHLDDATPEWLGALLEDALAEGALDAAFSPLQMKKNRPGVRLTVICRPEDEERFSLFLLHQSTTAGVRRSTCQRRTLQPRLLSIETALGPAQVKQFFDGGTLVRTTPEFESCRALARQHRLPLPEVYRHVQYVLDQEEEHKG